MKFEFAKKAMMQSKLHFTYVWTVVRILMKQTIDGLLQYLDLNTIFSEVLIEKNIETRLTFRNGSRIEFSLRVDCDVLDAQFELFCYLLREMEKFGISSYSRMLVRRCYRRF